MFSDIVANLIYPTFLRPLVWKVDTSSCIICVSWQSGAEYAARSRSQELVRRSSRRTGAGRHQYTIREILPLRISAM